MNIFKIILFNIIFFILTKGFAQHSFIWNYPDNLFGYCYVIEKGQGQYYFAGNFFNAKNSLLIDSAIVLKWNYQGDSITKVITKDSNIYNNTCFSLLIPHSLDGFIAIGYLGFKNNPDTNALWIVGFDSSLNQLWEIQYPLARSWFDLRAIKKLKNNNWLIALNTYYPAWPVDEQYFFFEITENGNITHIMPADTSGYVYDIVIHPETGYIYCMGNYIYPHNPSITWINIYDSNYNLINHKPVFPNDYYNKLSSPFGGQWISNDTFLFSSRKMYMQSTIQDEDICLYLMKETDSIVPIKENCFRRPNTKDYTVWKSFDITKNNQIIQIGQLDWLNWEKTWIGCYDKQLNLLYHHILTSPEWRNIPYAIFSTSDSGYFIFNTEYKGISFENSHLQIIKFDKEGNCQGLELHSNIRIEKHLVYPNPGSDYFMLELSHELLNKGQCLLELYNTNGRLQNQWTFEGNQVQIITDKIPIGLYYYRVIQNNKLIVTGKWIKIIK